MIKMTVLCALLFVAIFSSPSFSTSDESPQAQKPPPGSAGEIQPWDEYISDKGTEHNHHIESASDPKTNPFKATAHILAARKIADERPWEGKSSAFLHEYDAAVADNLTQASEVADSPLQALNCLMGAADALKNKQGTAENLERGADLLEKARRKAHVISEFGLNLFLQLKTAWLGQFLPPELTKGELSQRYSLALMSASFYIAEIDFLDWAICCNPHVKPSSMVAERIAGKRKKSLDGAVESLLQHAENEEGNLPRGRTFHLVANLSTHSILREGKSLRESSPAGRQKVSEFLKQARTAYKASSQTDLKDYLPLLRLAAVECSLADLTLENPKRAQLFEKALTYARDAQTKHRQLTEGKLSVKRDSVNFDLSQGTVTAETLEHISCAQLQDCFAVAENPTTPTAEALENLGKAQKLFKALRPKMDTLMAMQDLRKKGILPQNRRPKDLICYPSSRLIEVDFLLVEKDIWRWGISATEAADHLSAPTELKGRTAAADDALPKYLTVRNHALDLLQQEAKEAEGQYKGATLMWLADLHKAEAESVLDLHNRRGHNETALRLYEEAVIVYLVAEKLDTGRDISSKALDGLLGESFDESSQSLCEKMSPLGKAKVCRARARDRQDFLARVDKRLAEKREAATSIETADTKAS